MPPSCSRAELSQDNDVVKLLGSLIPNAVHLGEVFRGAGVVGRDQLRGLAKMPEPDLKEFLTAELGLTLYQARIIRIALREQYGNR